MPLEDISFRDYEMIVLYNLLLTQAKFSLSTQVHATLARMNHILALLDGSTLVQFET